METAKIIEKLDDIEVEISEVTNALLKNLSEISTKIRELSDLEIRLRYTQTQILFLKSEMKSNNKP